MATPYHFGYVTIGSLMMGSRAIECFEYAELTQSADKRGTDVTVESQSGRVPKGRLDDDSRRIVEVRINGAWTQDNAPTSPGTVASRIAAYYQHLAAVKAVAGVNSAQSITLTVGSDSWSGTATVERLSKPSRLNPWAYELAMDLTIHGGELS